MVKKRTANQTARVIGGPDRADEEAEPANLGVTVREGCHRVGPRGL